MTYDRDYVAALPFLKSYGIWSDMAIRVLLVIAYYF